MNYLVSTRAYQADREARAVEAKRTGQPMKPYVSPFSARLAEIKAEMELS